MKASLRALLPKHKRSLITDKFCETIERMEDPDFRESYKENFFRFIDVWEKHPRVRLQTFAQAVQFITYRLTGATQQQAFIRTFPDKYEQYVANGREEYVKQYSQAFAKRPVVLDLMERSMIPVYLLNADVHQEAINVQADLMRTAKSENVRMKAAECLILALKPPEGIEINVNVDHRSSQLDELREVTRKLAEEQKRAIVEGRVNVREIAEADIIDVNLLDLEEEASASDELR